MNRVFMFSSMKCYGNSGGGAGIMYRLYRANIRFDTFPDIYWIYQDKVIHCTEPCGELARRRQDRKGLRESFLGFIPGEVRGLLRVIKNSKLHNSNLDRIKMLCQIYKFSNNDVYICHDLQQAAAFLDLFRFDKVIFVDHSQGGSYNEWSSMCNKKSRILRNHYLKNYIKVIESANLIGFPSKGARTSLIKAEPNLSKVLDQSLCRYVYTGVDCKRKQQASEGISKDNKEIVFITVANLNYSKGVERIPQYIGHLKRKGLHLKWILIGNGIMEKKIEEEIVKNDLIKETDWRKDFLSHDLVISLFENTDFYIIFHRFSVFDISILEAMHMGNIPVLTPVGGNNDILSLNVGLAVTDFENTEELEHLIMNPKRLLRERNNVIKLCEREFCEKAFINRYKSIVDELGQQNDIKN